MESRYTWLKEKLQEQEIEKEMLMKEYIIRIKNFERIQEKLTKFK
jgi:predicted nuclease with TOPRIM domain